MYIMYSCYYLIQFCPTAYTLNSTLDKLKMRVTKIHQICVGPDIHINQTRLLDSYPAIWRALLFSPHRLLFPPPTFQNQDKKTLSSSPYFPTPPHLFILLLDLTETQFDQMCFGKYKKIMNGVWRAESRMTITKPQHDLGVFESIL